MGLYLPVVFAPPVDPALGGVGRALEKTRLGVAKAVVQAADQGADREADQEVEG